MMPEKFALDRLAADLSALAARHRGESDRLRHLAPALAEAFLAHDIYRLLLPPDLGGANADPIDYLELVERIARIDGSVGWNLTIGAGSGVYLGFVPTGMAGDIAATPDCCIAGALGPFGRGTKVDGGWRVGGRWGWASGVAQASWMVAGYLPIGEDGPLLDEFGRPMVRQVLAPRDAFTVLDTWHVGGLRGTGSADYEVADLFVPDHASFRAFNSPPCHPARVFQMPSAFFATAVAVVPLGIARGAIDGLTALAARKRMPGGRAGLNDQAFAQYAAAKAEAVVDSASLYLRQSIAAIWNTVRGGGTADLAARARCRGAVVHAGEASAEAVDLCCRAAGGNALAESEPFEKALRDVRAAIGHISMQRGAMEDVGRVAFGMAPNSPMF